MYTKGSFAAEADLSFRATKDIDMILILEDNFPEIPFKMYAWINLLDRKRAGF